MTMIKKTIFLSVAAVLLFLAGVMFAEKGKPLSLSLMSREEATPLEFDWGTFYTYHGDAETYGTRGTLVAIADIKPGHETHPPHQHEEEEFMLVLRGEGTMYVGEEKISTQKGDVLYTAPWDWHGIKNTGTEMLSFVVFKWNYKGLPQPPKPSEGSH